MDDSSKKMCGVWMIRSRYAKDNKSAHNGSAVRTDLGGNRETTASAKHVVREAKRVMSSMGGRGVGLGRVPSEKLD